MNVVNNIKNKILEYGERCPLCNEKLELDKLILISKCGHLYHIRCILEDNNGKPISLNKYKCKLCFDNF